MIIPLLHLRFQQLSRGLDPASSSTGLAYKSRIRQEPTNVAAPQWAHALWSRLTSLVEDMAGACVKVSSPTLSRRWPQWQWCLGLYLGESFEAEEGSDLADRFPRRSYEGELDRTTSPVTLVMFRRFWRISQAQPFGVHWPGLWRSRPGTGRRVR